MIPIMSHIKNDFRNIEPIIDIRVKSSAKNQISRDSFSWVTNDDLKSCMTIRVNRDRRLITRTEINSKNRL